MLFVEIQESRSMIKEYSHVSYKNGSMFFPSDHVESQSEVRFRMV